MAKTINDMMVEASKYVPLSQKSQRNQHAGALEMEAMYLGRYEKGVRLLIEGMVVDDLVTQQATQTTSSK